MKDGVQCIHSLCSPRAPSPHPLLQLAQSLCPSGPHPQDTHTSLHKVLALELPHPPHLPHPHSSTPMGRSCLSRSVQYGTVSGSLPQGLLSQVLPGVSTCHLWFQWRYLCVSFSLFPGGSNGKESACNAGDTGSIPGSGRSPGGGNGNPHQYPCPENPMDRGAYWATVYEVPKSWTRLSY